MYRNFLIIIATAVLSIGAPGRVEAETGDHSGELPAPLAVCTQGLGPTHKVLQVISGDTIELADGALVRLAGALPPYRRQDSDRSAERRTPHKAAAPSEISQRKPAPGLPAPTRTLVKELTRLLPGRTIRLAYGERRFDRYGRHLAQVVVMPDPKMRKQQPIHSMQRPPQNKAAGRSLAPIWLQAHLIAGGFARAYGVPGSAGCLAHLVRLEAEAIRARVGLWRLRAFHIRSAASPWVMKRDVGSHQIVEGRIISLGRARQRLYLNFGKNWQRDFTVAIKKKHLPLVLPAGIALQNLTGKLVRVRGWISWRGGPFIQADMAGQIEFLEDSGRHE